MGGYLFSCNIRLKISFSPHVATTLPDFWVGSLYLCFAGKRSKMALAQMDSRETFSNNWGSSFNRRLYSCTFLEAFWTGDFCWFKMAQTQIVWTGLGCSSSKIYCLSLGGKASTNSFWGCATNIFQSSWSNFFIIHIQHGKYYVPQFFYKRYKIASFPIKVAARVATIITPLVSGACSCVCKT